MSLPVEGTLDTNVLLRFILGDEPTQQKKATKLIEEKKHWHISMLTIAEIIFILEGKGFTRSEIKTNIEVIASYTGLRFARAVVFAALTLYVAHPALSFIDACLVFEAKVGDAEPLWTFDKKLAKQAPNVKLIA